jgi:hypothetical protein
MERDAQCICGVTGIAVPAPTSTTLEGRFEGEPQQFASIAEVMHKSASRPSGLGGDLPHRCARDTRADDDARRGSSELFATGNGINGARH